MTAKIIVVASQKGGSGKTTTTISLTGELVERGYRPLIVDLDIQGTAVAWISAAPEGKPSLAPVVNLAKAGGQANREIQRFLPDYDVILCDCPPWPPELAPQVSRAMLVADLLLIPCVSSFTDIDAALATVEQAKMAEASRLDPLPMRLLLNNENSRTRVAAAIDKLIEETGLPRLAASISTATAYRAAPEHGGTAARISPVARAEISDLADEILALVGLEPFKAQEEEI